MGNWHVLYRLDLRDTKPGHICGYELVRSRVKLPGKVDRMVNWCCMPLPPPPGPPPKKVQPIMMTKNKTKTPLADLQTPFTRKQFTDVYNIKKGVFLGSLRNSVPLKER